MKYILSLSVACFLTACFDTSTKEVKTAPVNVVTMPDYVDVEMNKPISVAPLENDFSEDQHPLEITTVNITQGEGDTSVYSNIVTYTPEPGFLGKTIITYTATNGESEKTESITINVIPRIGPPEAFNLTDLSIDDGGLMVTWDGLPQNVDYTVCLKDPDMADQCQPIAQESNRNNATIEHINPLKLAAQNIFVQATGSSGLSTLSNEIRVANDAVSPLIKHLKAPKNETNNEFGTSLALTDDGQYMFVGHPLDDSFIDDQNQDWSNADKPNSGAVLVYQKDQNDWKFIQFIKAPIIDQGDEFGRVVATNHDGSVIAISAPKEHSNSTTTIGDMTNNDTRNAGAVFIYRKNLTNNLWEFHDYLKHPDPNPYDEFGFSIALCDTGSTIAIGVPYDDSNARGIDNDYTNNDARNSGALVVFNYDSTTKKWTQSGYIKSDNADPEDEFGFSVDITGNGRTIATSAPLDDTDGLGLQDTGAVYIYTLENSWMQSDYIKPYFDRNSFEQFGTIVKIDRPGQTLAISAHGNDFDHDEFANFGNPDSGGAYVYHLSDALQWEFNQLIKAPTAGAADRWGTSLEMDKSGKHITLGAINDDSGSAGFADFSHDNKSSDSGGVVVFERTGLEWHPTNYIKPTSNDAYDQFGSALAMSDNNETMIISAPADDSMSIGTDVLIHNNDHQDSGIIMTYH